MTSVETNDLMPPTGNPELTQSVNTMDTATPNTVTTSYLDVIQTISFAPDAEKIMHEETLLKAVQASHFVIDPSVCRDELSFVYQNLHYATPNTSEAVAFTTLATQAFQHPQHAGQMTYHLHSTPYQVDTTSPGSADVILPSPVVNQLAGGRTPAPGQVIYPEATPTTDNFTESSIVAEEFEDGLESYLKQYVKVNDAQEKINLRTRIISDVVDGFLVFPKVTDPSSGEPRLLAVRNPEGKTALPVFTSSQYFDSWLSQETTSHAATSTLEMFADEVTDAVLNTLNYVLINPGSRYAVGLHREELQNKQSLLAAEVSEIIVSTPDTGSQAAVTTPDVTAPAVSVPSFQLTLGAGVLLTDTSETKLLEALAPYHSDLNYVYTMMAQQGGSNTYQPTLMVSGSLTLDTERYNQFLSTMTALLSETMNTAFNVYAVPAELSSDYATKLDKLSDPIYASDSNVVVYDCSNQKVLDVMYDLMVNQDLGELYGKLLNSKIYTLVPSNTVMDGNDFPLMMLNMPNGEQVHPIFTNREAIRAYIENPLEQGQCVYLYSFSDACHAANIQNVDSIFINPAGPALHEVKRVEFESLAQGLLPGSKTILERENTYSDATAQTTEVATEPVNETMGETSVDTPIETEVSANTITPTSETTLTDVAPTVETTVTESPLITTLRQVAVHPNLNSKAGLGVVKAAYETLMTQLVVVPMEKESLPTEFAPIAFSGDNNEIGLVLFTDESTCNTWRNGKESVGRIDKIPFNTLCQYAQQLNVNYLIVNHEQETSLTVPADDFRFLALGQLPEMLNHIEAAPNVTPPTSVEPATIPTPEAAAWETPTENPPLTETVSETPVEQQPLPAVVQQDVQPPTQPAQPTLVAPAPITAENFFLLDAINASVPNGFNTKLVNQYAVYTTSEGTDKLDAVINIYQELLNGCLLIPIPDQPRAGDPLPLPTITDENNLPAALVFSIQPSLKDFCKDAFLPDDYALVPVSVIIDEAFKQGVQKLLLTMAENGQVFVITEGCMGSLLAGEVPEAEALMEDYNISVSSNPLSGLAGLAKKIPGLNKSKEPKASKPEKSVTSTDGKAGVGNLFGKVKDMLGKEM